MRRIFFATLLIFSVAGFSVTAVYASPAPPPAFEPCDPDYRLILEHQADAVRVRNRAYEVELITTNESTLKLTCYDQAMRLTTRLGYVFSDVIPPSPPVYNAVVFAWTLAYSGWGSQQLMAKRLNTVMNSSTGGYLGMYDRWLSNFPPDIIVPSPFPLNALAALVTAGTVIQDAIRDIIDYQNPTDKNMASQVTVYTQQINKLIAGIPKVAASSLGAYIANIWDIIKLRDAQIKLIDTTRNDVMPPLLARIKNTIMGSATAMDCTRMDDYWENGNPASNFAPPSPTRCGMPVCESVCVSNTTMCCEWGPAPFCPPNPDVPPKDYFGGTPYYKLEDLFNRVLPGASMAFLEQVTSSPPAVFPVAVNGAILDQAAKDLMVLKEPGILKTWPETPLVVFAPKATVRQIVDEMDVP